MKLNEFIKKILFNFFIIIFIFFLDRLSKNLVLEYFNQSIDQSFVINSYLRFTLLWNGGVAFGLLHFEEKLFYNIITSIICIVLIIVIWLSIKSSGLKRICYLMILGGGLGNIFDRLHYGSVIDFIDINYKNFHWFIFNVADIFITIGILLLVISELKKND